MLLEDVSVRFQGGHIIRFLSGHAPTSPFPLTSVTLKASPNPAPSRRAQWEIASASRSRSDTPHGRRPAGFRFGIESFNDNSTPMKFVVSTLGAHLGLSYREGARAMLAIHGTGGALFATCSCADAQRIPTAITAEATRHNHALLCRALASPPELLPMSSNNRQGV
jgi:ATP-dependent Clp protease adapter protein ClpS